MRAGTKKRGVVGKNKGVVKIIFTKLLTTSIKMLSKQSNIQRGDLCSAFVFDCCICLLMHIHGYMCNKRLHTAA